MTSIIAARWSTHVKLSVFDGLIVRANSIPPSVFLSTAAGLGYLAYYFHTLPTNVSLVTARESGMQYAIATASLMTMVGLQVVIVPKNNAMQEIVSGKKSEYENDNGVEGNEMVGELNRWNRVRMVLSGIAVGIGIVEMAII